MKTTITVTQEHIKNGEHGVHECPIALTLREIFDTNNVLVITHAARIDGKLYRLSERAQYFIDDFDNGIKVFPFSFEIESND